MIKKIKIDTNKTIKGKTFKGFIFCFLLKKFLKGLFSKNNGTKREPAKYAITIISQTIGFKFSRSKNWGNKKNDTRGLLHKSA